jgi:hypothetical protein
MEESPSQLQGLGEAPSPLPRSPKEELRAGFASFKAFLESQQNQRERKGKELEFYFMCISILYFLK